MICNNVATLSTWCTSCSLNSWSDSSCLINVTVATDESNRDGSGNLSNQHCWILDTVLIFRASNINLTVIVCKSPFRLFFNWLVWEIAFWDGGLVLLRSYFAFTVEWNIGQILGPNVIYRRQIDALLVTAEYCVVYLSACLNFMLIFVGHIYIILESLRIVFLYRVWEQFPKLGGNRFLIKINK